MIEHIILGGGRRLKFNTLLPSSKRKCILKCTVEEMRKLNVNLKDLDMKARGGGAVLGKNVHSVIPITITIMILRLEIETCLVSCTTIILSSTG
jgi:hypothetical protein